jgi:endonuclease/exonuclease/phosphatase family metal-dependent hydrolase
MTRAFTHLVTRRALSWALLGLWLAPASVFAQTPGQVSNPTPANGATNVATTTALSWSAATDAIRYDVRLGTTNPPPIVARNHKDTFYQPASPLLPGMTYYWQIDARGKGNSVTPGPVWSFTTAAAPTPAPSAPSAPSPADGAADVVITTALSWADSTDATGYDVAFGTANPPPVVSSHQAGTTYDPPGDLTHAATYYWQVTARGDGGTTAGPVWSFTTAAAPPVSTALDRLRVMSWNVRMGMNLAGSMNVDAQVALMADSGAHVIVLQEVTITSGADLPALYESGLETLTGQQWNAVWAPAPRPSTTTPEGNLILTMLPIVSSSTLSIDSAPSDPTWLDSKRSAAQVEIVVNEQPVHVFGTHLALDAAQRASQLETLRTWISGFPAPRLIGGDFNMVEGEPEYLTMAGSFADVWPMLAPGDQGFTMDSRASAGHQPGRIDYWWQELSATQALSTEVWVVKTSRSDHHALVADVRVQP